MTKKANGNSRFFLLFAPANALVTVHENNEVSGDHGKNTPAEEAGVSSRVDWVGPGVEDARGVSWEDMIVPGACDDSGAAKVAVA